MDIIQPQKRKRSEASHGLVATGPYQAFYLTLWEPYIVCQKERRHSPRIASEYLQSLIGCKELIHVSTTAKLTVLELSTVMGNRPPILLQACSLCSYGNPDSVCQSPGVLHSSGSKSKSNITNIRVQNTKTMASTSWNWKKPLENRDNMFDARWVACCLSQ